MISTTEGGPAYGGIGTTLSTKGDTSPKAGTDIKIAPAGGSTSYRRTITLDRRRGHSLKAGTAVIVVHGLDPATLSKKAQNEKSDLVPSLPLAATSPALCGVLSVDARRRRGHRYRLHRRVEDLGLLAPGGGASRPRCRRGGPRASAPPGRPGLMSPEYEVDRPLVAPRRRDCLWRRPGRAGRRSVILIAVAVAAQVRAPSHRGRRQHRPTGPARLRDPGDRQPARRRVAGPGGSGAVGRLPPGHDLDPLIGVSSEVNPIGLAPDGTLAVPQPGPDLDQAAWFQNSPTPGQPGPAIIEGHVDTAAGPSVFFELGKLRPAKIMRDPRRRDAADVHRQRRPRLPQGRFPTEAVYGAKDLGAPAAAPDHLQRLRPATRHHEGNEVVFAHLTRVEPELPAPHPESATERHHEQIHCTLAQRGASPPCCS